MIKNILFDFDGVILDSMKIKGDAFVELFKNYDTTKIKLLEKYHYENGGISRFEKIRYFFNTILNEEVSETKILQLSDLFSNLIKDKLLNKHNLITETIDFISNNQNKYNFHIVSGAEHFELNHLCKQFNIKQYFITINGSPTKKDVLVKNILNKYNYISEETILIGDSINDFDAAEKNNIKFHGYNNLKLKKLNYINSFKTFHP